MSASQQISTVCGRRDNYPQSNVSQFSDLILKRILLLKNVFVVSQK